MAKDQSGFWVEAFLITGMITGCLMIVAFGVITLHFLIKFW